MRFLVLRPSVASGGGVAGFGGAAGVAGMGADLARGLGTGAAGAGTSSSVSVSETFRNGAIERVTPFHRTRSSLLSRRLLMPEDRACSWA